MSDARTEGHRYCGGWTSGLSLDLMRRAPGTQITEEARAWLAANHDAVESPDWVVDQVRRAAAAVRAEFERRKGGVG